MIVCPTRDRSRGNRALALAVLTAVALPGCGGGSIDTVERGDRLYGAGQVDDGREERPLLVQPQGHAAPRPLTGGHRDRYAHPGGAG